MLQGLFGLLYVLVAPVWIVMLLFPRADFTRRTVTSNWPFIILGGTQAVLILAALTGVPAQQLGISAQAFRALLLGDWGLLAVWAQILTLNLFAGVWIFRDSGFYGIRPAPHLLLTHFTGPVGLAVYLLLRRRAERRSTFRTLN